MYRVPFSVLLLILVWIVTNGCVSSPSITEPGAEETERLSPGSSAPANEEDGRLPEDAAISPIPALPDPEQADRDLPSGEDDDPPPNESGAGDAPEPWTAPTSTAPDRPDAQQRRSIAAWVLGRPLRITEPTRRSRGGHTHSLTGAQDLLYRSYLNQLLADAEIVLDQGAAESAIALTVIPEFRSDDSDRNAYGATTLIVLLRLEGPGSSGTEARTELHGPLVLSRVSHEDAHLNSLRRIDPTAMGRAVNALRGELAEMVADRGIPFSVTRISGQFVDRTDEDVYAVLRSLGVPDEPERVWRLYDSPEHVRQEIAALLVGSAYRFLLNPLTREIRFLYNDES